MSEFTIDEFTWIVSCFYQELHEELLEMYREYLVHVNKGMVDAQFRELCFRNLIHK